MNAERKKVLPGTLWLGSAGALLILGGIAALLASNWVRVPFAAQLAVAFTPLVCGWAGYLWIARRETISLAHGEILGIVWTGGVICSIALLGRILQLSSSTFAFAASVAALLLPVAFALRSTAAWTATLGFAIAAAVDLIVTAPGVRDTLFALAFILAVSVILFARIRFAWRENNLYALGQRSLAAIGTIAVALTLGAGLLKLWNELSLMGDQTVRLFFSFPPALALPLTLGLLLERDNAPRERPLMLFGAVAFCAPALGFISGPDADDAVLWWGGSFVLVSLVVLAVFARVLLRREGLFLLLLPILGLSLAFGAPLISLTLAIGVGAAVITAGVRTGERMIANEGLLFTIAAAFVLFAKTDMALTWQGFFLVVSGLALVALNLVLARLDQKGASHAS